MKYAVDLLITRGQLFFVFVLVLACTQGKANDQISSNYKKEAIIHIRSEPDSSSKLGHIEECDVEHYLPSCQTSLDLGIEMLNSPLWQKIISQLEIRSIKVLLPDGKLKLNHPIEIHWSLATSLIFIGNKSTLSGSRTVELTHSSKNPNLVDLRTPIEIYSNLFAGKLQFTPKPFSPRGFRYPITPISGELIFDDTPQPLAGWPNSGYTKIRGVSQIEGDSNPTFVIEHPWGGKDWSLEKDIQMSGYWYWDWSYQTLEVAYLGENTWRHLSAGSPYGIKVGQRVRIENALSELDTPSEWFLNNRTQTIYFWPPNTTTPDKSVFIEWSLIPTLLHIKASRNIEVRSVNFENSTGDAIIIEDGTDIQLTGIKVINSGNRGVRVDGGNNVLVANSFVLNSGTSGISINGGDRKILKASNHRVENSTICGFSRLIKTYTPGIRISGVGQRVLNNTICKGPHSGIEFFGNSHLISGNEIFDVLLETDDAGAIYAGRDFTAQGTRITNNYIHRIGNIAFKNTIGVYLDDQLSGTIVDGNIFSDVEKAVLVGGGRNNTIRHNLFYNTKNSVYLDARGLSWQRDALLSPDREWLKSLKTIPINNSQWTHQFPELQNLINDDFGTPKHNTIHSNLIIKSKPIIVESRAIPYVTLDSNISSTEDIFIKPAKNGVRSERQHFNLHKPNFICNHEPNYSLCGGLSN